jgi:hypothetical protein
VLPGEGCWMALCGPSCWLVAVDCQPQHCEVAGHGGQVGWALLLSQSEFWELGRAGQGMRCWQHAVGCGFISDRWLTGLSGFCPLCRRLPGSRGRLACGSLARMHASNASEWLVWLVWLVLG